MKKYVMFCFFNVVCALAVGFGAYIILRNNTIINTFFQVNTPLSNSVIGFYLPDFLWAYALCFTLAIFCKWIYAFIISSCFGVIWELLQKSGYLTGTFDYLDIIMYISASSIAVLLVLQFKRRERL